MIDWLATTFIYLNLEMKLIAHEPEPPNTSLVDALWVHLPKNRRVCAYAIGAPNSVFSPHVCVEFMDGSVRKSLLVNIRDATLIKWMGWGEFYPDDVPSFSDVVLKCTGSLPKTEGQSIQGENLFDNQPIMHADTVVRFLLMVKGTRLSRWDSQIYFLEFEWSNGVLRLRNFHTQSKYQFTIYYLTNNGYACFNNAVVITTSGSTVPHSPLALSTEPNYLTSEEGIAIKLSNSVITYSWETGRRNFFSLTSPRDIYRLDRQFLLLNINGMIEVRDITDGSLVDGITTKLSYVPIAYDDSTNTTLIITGEEIYGHRFGRLFPLYTYATRPMYPKWYQWLSWNSELIIYIAKHPIIRLALEWAEH